MVFVWYDYCFASKDLTGMVILVLILQTELAAQLYLLCHTGTLALSVDIVRPERAAARARLCA